MSGVHSTHAQTGESRYFPATGHWVEGEFLAKYESVEDAGLIFGNPITEIITDRISLTKVQYFERARFELHNDDFPSVQLTYLGELTYEAGPSLSVPATAQACKRFQSNGPRVCFAFLRFLEDHGGIDYFGFPISGFEIHNGYIVQYFQRARFEWHPDQPAGQQVVLTNLGFTYFGIRGEPIEQLKPAPADFIFGYFPQSLKIYTFPHYPVLSSSGHQIISIIVQDEYSRPVQGAEVTGLVILPDGQVITLAKQLTNNDGLAITSPILISTHYLGVAEIIIHVRFGSAEEQTGTSFQIW